MESIPSVFDAKIRNRMLFRILGAACVVLLIMGLVIYVVTRRLLHDEVQAKSETMVTFVASSIDRWLVEKSAALTALAEVESQYTAPHPTQRAYFTIVGKQISDPPGVYMGYDGGPFLSTKTGGTLPPGYDHHKRPWYKEAVAKDRLIFTTPYVDARTGGLIITIASPVKNATRLIGVIAVDLFIDVLLQHVTALRIGQQSMAYLVDRTGLYITHPQRDLVLTGNIAASSDAEFFRTFVASEEGSAIYTAPSHYTIISRIPSAEWFLVFHLPYAEVQQPLRTLTLIFLTGIVLTLIVLGGVILMISHFITRPILRLADGASAIVEGDYTIKLPIPGRDELGLVTSSFNHMAEGLKDRDFIKSTFGRYLSNDVVKALLESPDGLRLGGEVRELTMLVSDLRGFSSMVAQLPPQTVVDITNRYLARMIAILTQYRGTVDEFQGDGILAFFGAPLQADDDPERAVACALAMQSAMTEVNAEQRRLGLPELAMGIGINTGEVIVGNIGSEQRTKYGAMGSAINTAYRIESYTVSGQVLISPALYARVQHLVQIEGTMEVQFKGVNEPITLYDISGIGAPYNIVLPDKVPEVFTPLTPSLPIACHRLEGKALTDDVIAGHLNALADSSARARLAGPVALHDNVHITLISDTETKHDAYAKVVACEAPQAGETDTVAVLKFTAMSDETKTFLEQCRAG